MLDSGVPLPRNRYYQAKFELYYSGVTKENPQHMSPKKSIEDAKSEVCRERNLNGKQSYIGPSQATVVQI
jgi:hypothetical protein